MYQKKKPNEDGYTLMEVMGVVALLGILYTLVGAPILDSVDKAKSKMTMMQINKLENSLILYRLDTGSYPTTEQGLDVLIQRPEDAARWGGPYLTGETVPLDSWGNPYHYTNPGNHSVYDLYSWGGDNTEGGFDDDADVTNWEE